MKFLSKLFHAYFEEAAEAGVEERLFRIAGRTVAMRFAGDRWVDTFTRALGHLLEPTGSPDLTLHVWDGGARPRNHLLRAYLFTLTNWWFEYTGPRGQLLDIHSNEMAAMYDPLSGLLSLVDYEGGSGFLWKRDLSEMPYFEICAPARVLLHAWFRSQSIQMVHGAAIGTENGGVLLAGPGGSGKSTSALACLDSGLRYLSDDYCMVSRDRSGFRVHSLYGAAKLVDESDFRRLPRLAESVWNVQRAPGEKLAFFINEQRPEKLIGEFPLSAILVPTITGSHQTALEPCPPAHALEALAPSTMAQMPSSGAPDLAFMAEMVRRVPCYRLHAGTDVSRIPIALAELLTPSSAGCAPG
jgi:hypothetical protein